MPRCTDHANQCTCFMCRSLEELAMAQEELAALRDCSTLGGDPVSCTVMSIKEKQEEMAALRTALKVCACMSACMCVGQRGMSVG